MANVPALTDEERAELQRLRTEVTRLRTEVEAEAGDVPAVGRGPARQRWRTIVASLPARERNRELHRSQVDRVVQSDPFADAWVSANRVAHEQLVAA